MSEEREEKIKRTLDRLIKMLGNQEEILKEAIKHDDYQGVKSCEREIRDGFIFVLHHDERVNAAYEKYKKMTGKIYDYLSKKAEIFNAQRKNRGA